MTPWYTLSSASTTHLRLPEFRSTGTSSGLVLIPTPDRPQESGPDMPKSWRALLRWVHTSQHTWQRDTHELERVVNPLASPDATVVDLCLPLQEQLC